MYEGFVLKNCKNCCSANAVICAECSAVCCYPLAVDICLDWIVFKVENLVVILLRNHIEVRLNNNALAILHTRSGRLANIYIICLVDCVLKALCLCKVDYILSNLLLVVRWVRNVTNRRKVLPYKRWSKRAKIFVHKL